MWVAGTCQGRVSDRCRGGDAGGGLSPELSGGRGRWECQYDSKPTDFLSSWDYFFSPHDYGWSEMGILTSTPETPCGSFLEVCIPCEHMVAF